MAKANLTLHLDVDVIRRAKIIAAKRGTSVSGLVAHDLGELVDQDERYEDAMRRAMEILVKATARGGRSWQRDELHER